MSAAKWKTNLVEMTRLIMGRESRLMLQNAMRLVTPTITEAMAKVTHKEEWMRNSH